jgi:nucleotide-binding universal stress UspA family protein
MNFKKLLFVTKFEELGFEALKTMLNLKEVALQHVVFMTVIERDQVAMQRGTGYDKKGERKLRETANIRFIDWAEHLFEMGMEVGAYIVVGTLIPQIILAAKKEEADLIVIGRTQKGLLEQFYSGSEVVELLNRTALPVLVYPPRPDLGAASGHLFDTPLLATDFSPASNKSLEYTKSLHKVIKQVHVMHVISEKDLKGNSNMLIQQSRKEARKKLDQLCDELEAAGIDARPHVYVGEPVEEIEKATKECGASLTILGSSAKAAWIERFIGSIPRRIAEKSPTPTLIIPPNQSAT